MKIITCNDGAKIRRLSRWIKIRQAYDVTSRHSLYDFCTDENGYHPYNEKFNPENGTYLDYFIYDGRKYALEDFYRCGSMWIVTTFEWTEKDGLHYMAGIEMSGDIYNPLMIELDEYCERVRVYDDPPKKFYAPNY